MATTLALAMRASMSATGVVSGAKQAAKAMDRLGDQARKTSSDLSLIKNIAIGAVVAKGIGMAASAFSSAARSALSYATSVANSVDATNDLAERTGIGVESLQALQMAAKLSGIDDVTGAVQKLGVSIGKAAESGNAEGFTRLGLSIQSLLAMSPEKQFMAVQRAISAIQNPAQRAAAAVEIFGKSGVELLPLMSKNVASIETKMRSLGAIVGTDQVQAISAMNDALDEVKTTFAGITAQVISSLAPVVKGLAEDLLKFVASFKSVSGNGGQGIANTIADGLLQFAEVLAKVFDSAVGSLGGIATRLESVYKAADKAAQFIPFARAVRGLAGGGAQASVSGGGAAGIVAQARQAFANRSQVSAPGTQAAGVPFWEMNDRANAAAIAERKRQAESSKQAALERFRQAGQQLMDDRAAAAKKAQEDRTAKQLSDQKDKTSRLAGINGDIEAKKKEGRDFLTERKAALGGKSNEALRANDIRSGEGMAQFLALATGREDPAIAEYRKQTQKLDEIRGELRALQTEKVTILNGAGA